MRAARPRAVLADIGGGLVAATTCLALLDRQRRADSGASQPLLVADIAAGLLTTAVTAIVMALTSTFEPVVATANATTAAPLEPRRSSGERARRLRRRGARRTTGTGGVRCCGAPARRNGR